MKKNDLFKPIFLLSILAALVGGALKILHLSGVHILVILSTILTIISSIIALIEIYNSQRLTLNEKAMWTVGFVILSTITGFLYLLIGRPRLFHNDKTSNF